MTQTKRTLSLMFAAMLIVMQGLVWIAAAEDTQPNTLFTITAETNRVRKKQTLQLHVDTESAVKWSSSDADVAIVDENGLVTGVSIGHATITAQAVDTDTEATFKVYVVRAGAPWRKLLEKYSMLGYQYSFEDDYYYTDDINCWQKFFGFNFAFDSISPLILFEYDYTRAFFTYDNRDWMIQMWKGQYGLVFYGSEVGVYNKPEGQNSANWHAHYAAAEEKDFLKISTALYHKNYATDEYTLEFETPYEPHWWATGFVPGHLLDTTPCKELRLCTRITLKDEEMASKFAEALIECGFESVSSQDKIRDDTFYLDGADVFLQWQNLSEAANSHMVQASFWGFVGINGLILGFFLLLILLFFGGIGAVLLLVLI